MEPVSIHDLANQLTTILGSVARLRESGLSQDQQAILDDIEAASRTAVRPLQLGDHSDFVSALTALCKDDAITLDHQLFDPVHTVDTTRLLQIVRWMIECRRESAGRHADFSLRVTHADRTFHCSSCDSPTSVAGYCLALTDNGEHIRRNLLPLLFEQQLGNGRIVTRAAPVVNNWHGLTTLVHQLQGHLHVASVPGHTVLDTYLPRLSQQASVDAHS